MQSVQRALGQAPRGACPHTTHPSYFVSPVAGTGVAFLLGSAVAFGGDEGGEAGCDGGLVVEVEHARAANAVYGVFDALAQGVAAGGGLGVAVLAVSWTMSAELRDTSRRLPFSMSSGRTPEPRKASGNFS